MRKKLLLPFLFALVSTMFFGCSSDSDINAATKTTDSNYTTDLSSHTLMIYCGAGMTKPFTAITDKFKEETGCEVSVTYANAGQIQSQISLSEEGDFFIAGSSDELEAVSDYISEKTDLVKHIPVLAVAADNPLDIACLNDLVSEHAALVIGDTKATPIGKIAFKAFSNLSIYEDLNIIATTTTAPELITAITVDEADAAIVWKENCNVNGVEIVPTTDLDKYIKTVPAAKLTCSTDAEATKAFMNFLSTKDAQDIWVSYGYEICE